MRRCRVLYVSPLKALAVDVERNLRAPLAGMRRAARRLGRGGALGVGQRPQRGHAGRRAPPLRASPPPDVLITTPESLFLAAHLAGPRGAARGRDRHRRRGARGRGHQAGCPPRAQSLERLDALLERARPADRAVGHGPAGRGGRALPRRSADRGRGRAAAVGQGDLELEVVVPGRGHDRDRRRRPARSTAPPPVPHSATVALAARRGARRRPRRARTGRRSCSRTPDASPSACTARLNELARARRQGCRRGAMRRGGHGAEGIGGAPTSRRPITGRVEGAAFADRGGAQVRPAAGGRRDQLPRAGHRHGRRRPRGPGRVTAIGGQRAAADRPRRSPGRRGVAGRRVPQAPRRPAADRGGRGAHAGRRRSRRCRCPRNPLDVLAQQVVSMVAMDEWPVDEVLALVRRAAPVPRPPASRRFEAVLDMLSGRYPSDEFAELRPRLVWDRVDRHAQRAARRAAPGRDERRDDPRPGAVRRLPRRRRRGAPAVGELDEEMVYESRVGDVFALGATTWRIEDITHDRVLVSPAPGVPGQDAVLARRLSRPSRRAGRGARGVRSRDRSRRVAGGGQPSARRRPRRVRGHQPRRVRGGAAHGHRARPGRPDGRRRAVPRRAG